MPLFALFYFALDTVTFICILPRSSPVVAARFTFFSHPVAMLVVSNALQLPPCLIAIELLSTAS
jgi:hypothetical protein